MALPLAEPGALAAVRAEAAQGDPRMQLVSSALDAIWAEISGVHQQNETAHASINARINVTDGSLTTLNSRLQVQEGNAQVIQNDGTQLGSTVTQLANTVQTIQANLDETKNTMNNMKNILDVKVIACESSIAQLLSQAQAAPPSQWRLQG